jgi:hypothetical protein
MAYRDAQNMKAEEVLNTIDDLLQSVGYDSWRQDQSTDFDKVGDAFLSFWNDWKQTRTGELRDEITSLQKWISRLYEESGISVKFMMKIPDIEVPAGSPPPDLFAILKKAASEKKGA